MYTLLQQNRPKNKKLSVWQNRSRTVGNECCWRKWRGREGIFRWEEGPIGSKWLILLFWKDFSWLNSKKSKLSWIFKGKSGIFCYQHVSLWWWWHKSDIFLSFFDRKDIRQSIVDIRMWMIGFYWMMQSSLLSFLEGRCCNGEPSFFTVTTVK